MLCNEKQICIPFFFNFLLVFVEIANDLWPLWRSIVVDTVDSEVFQVTAANKSWFSLSFESKKQENENQPERVDMFDEAHCVLVAVDQSQTIIGRTNRQKLCHQKNKDNQSNFLNL